MKRLVSTLLAVLIMGVALVGVSSTAAHAYEGCSDQGGSNQWKTSVGQEAPSAEDCEQVERGGFRGKQVTPKNSDNEDGNKKQGQSDTGTEEKGSAEKEEKPAPKPYADDEPTDSPTQWAEAAAEGAQGLAQEMKSQLEDDDLYGQTKFDKDFVAIYVVMFALGWVIAIVATMIAVTKMADRRIDGMLLARKAALRLFLFSPVASLLPFLASLVGSVTASLAGGFFGMAKERVLESLDWMILTVGGLGLSSMFIPGGSAVVFGLFGFVMAALGGVLVELLASKFMVYLMALLVPVLFAASINPSWGGSVKKVTGTLIGAYLTPAALFLVWAAAWGLVAGPEAPTSKFMRILVFLVGMLVALAAPIAVGLILSHVLPGFVSALGAGGLVPKIGKGGGGGRKPGGGPAEQVNASRSGRASNAADIARGDANGGIGPGMARHGSAVTAASPGVGSGSAGSAGAGGAGATAGAGAAAGPIAAVAAMWNKIRRKTQQGAEQAQQQAGSAADRTTQTPERGGESQAGESRDQTASGPPPGESKTSPDAGSAPDGSGQQPSRETGRPPSGSAPAQGPPPAPGPRPQGPAESPIRPDGRPGSGPPMNPPRQAPPSQPPRESSSPRSNVPPRGRR